MNEQIKDILEHMRQLEDRLEAEFEVSRAKYEVRVRGRIAEFADEVKARHRLFRIKWSHFFRAAKLLNVLVAPIIYSLIVPIVLVDFWVTLYQQICFRAYGIPLVKRPTFVMMDHHHLSYLNFIEKFNCVYCSYGNGVFGYAREIASRTEQFWCPIKHALRVRDPHKRYAAFLDYGDAEGFRAKLEEQRKEAQTCE